MNRPTPGNTRPVLITGGAGFIGSNLADRLAADGHHVLIYDALLRPGVEENLAWLKQRYPARVSAIVEDLRNEAALREAASQACAVFHFAAQVAVTTSLLDPLEDFDVNLRGTMVLLEALRRRREKPPLIFASTNKVYGDLADVTLIMEGAGYRPRDPALHAHGIGEDRPLSFHTPYGCSKGAADQYVLDYARSFGVPTAVLRMSCIYGRRQKGTEDQGWLAHFMLQALAGEPIRLYGDGRQVRDVLAIDDALDAYVGAWRRIAAISGRAFNLGGGPGNAVSLLQVIGEIEAILGRPVERQIAAWRPGDQRWFVADARQASAALGLRPPLGWRQGLEQLAAELAAERPGGRQRALAASEAT